MAIYAVGDIHGCLKALQTIFNQELIKKGDTVVFLGDYVDRGPDSKGVFDWLLKNKNNYTFEFILGNHEIMMQTARIVPERLFEWLHFGGTQTLDSYKIGNDPNWMDKIDNAHWEFMDSCNRIMKLENSFLFMQDLKLEKN